MTAAAIHDLTAQATRLVSTCRDGGVFARMRARRKLLAFARRNLLTILNALEASTGTLQLIEGKHRKALKDAWYSGRLAEGTYRRTKKEPRCPY